MNKEQQIEEMAVIGCVRNPQAHIAEECAKCDFKQGCCNAYRHAEALYNVGYRKIPENVVILTPGEITARINANYEERKRLEKQISLLEAEIATLIELNSPLLKNDGSLFLLSCQRMDYEDLIKENTQLKELIKAFSHNQNADIFKENKK
nr:MAG TPA: hypothetical protein [Caudoviricetes sp.]